MRAESVLSRVSDVYSEIGGQINEFFRDLKYSASSFRTDSEIKTKLTEIWDKIEEWANNEMHHLTDGLRVTGNKLASFGDKLSEIDRSTFDKLKKSTANIQTNTDNFIDFLNEKFVNGIKWFKGTLETSEVKEKESLNNVEKNTNKFINAIGKKSVNFFSNVGKRIKKISTDFITEMEEFKAKRASKWDTLKSKIKKILDNSKTKIVAGTAIVASSIQNGLSRFKSIFQEMRESIAKKFNSIRGKKDEEENLEISSDDSSEIITENIEQSEVKNTIENYNNEIDETISSLERQAKNSVEDNEQIDINLDQKDSDLEEDKEFEDDDDLEEDEEFEDDDDLEEDEEFEDDDDLEEDEELEEEFTVSDTWKFIEFQMNSAYIYPSLAKSFDVQDFVEKVNNIINIAGKFLDKEINQYNNIEECLAIVASKFPKLKGDIQIVTDALKKLCSDLTNDIGPLNDLDKKNISKFINIINHNDIKIGFNLDNYVYEIPNNHFVAIENYNNLADIGVYIINIEHFDDAIFDDHDILSEDERLAQSKNRLPNYNYCTIIVSKIYNNNQVKDLLSQTNMDVESLLSIQPKTLNYNLSD